MPAYTNDTGEGGRRQLIGAIVLFVVAVSTAFLPPTQQQHVAAAVRGTLLRPFVSMQGGLQVARNRTADSGPLRRQLDSLVAVTSGHLTLLEENRRLTALLDLKQRIGAGWVSANVVRPGTSGSESMFLLDIGRAQGVQPYAPIVVGQGIVGYVREVAENSSVAMDWTHPDFSVSAMDGLGTIYGMVKSRRGEFREEDRLEMDGTAFQTRLEDETVIVTSNLSGIFPRGIPIGKVAGLAEADAGWRKSYWLRPMVEVGSVTHVLVGVEPSLDLFGVWPLETALTDAELAVQLQAREDSLRALGDSVALLRTVLSAPQPLRDSVLAALLLGEGVAVPAMLPGPGGAPLAPGTQPPTSAGATGAGRAQTTSGAAPARSTGAPAAGQPATGQPPRAAPPATGTVGDPTSRFPRPTDTLRLRPPTDSAPPIPRPRPDTLVRPDTMMLSSLGRRVRPGTPVESGTLVEGGIREGGASPR